MTLFLLFTLLSCTDLKTAWAQSEEHASASAASVAEAVVGERRVPGDDADVSDDAVDTAEHDADRTDDEADGAAAGDWRELLELDDAELERMLLETPEVFGALSLGPTNAGALLFPVQIHEHPRWHLVKASQSWGTEETIQYLGRAIDKVREQFPEGTRPLHVGDISRKRGGYFYPHVNHQTGRDVDIGFYYQEETPWYRKAYRSNLDVPRTWALMRALVTETDLELIYCDRFVILLVLRHAREIGENEAWLDRIFREPSPTYPRPLIRHEPGHRTHLHVRFHNPKAQTLARRLHHLLAKHGMIRPPMVFAEHTVKTGETLAKVARSYRTTRHGIRTFNKMANDELEVGQVYKVPHEGSIEYPEQPIEIPPRILP